MIEFFNNIGQWIVANKEVLLTVFSGIDVAGLVSAIFILIKGNKKSDENTKATKNLNENMEQTIELKNAVENNTKSNEKLTEDMVLLKQENEELKHSNENILSKFDAVLDVMSVVYSTLKDETVRNTVNNIIVNAKYAETNTKAALEQQVKELQEKVEQDAELLKNKVKEETEKVKTLLNPIKNNTRY